MNIHGYEWWPFWGFVEQDRPDKYSHGGVCKCDVVNLHPQVMTINGFYKPSQMVGLFIGFSAFVSLGRRQPLRFPVLLRSGSLSGEAHLRKAGLPRWWSFLSRVFFGWNHVKPVRLWRAHQFKISLMPCFSCLLTNSLCDSAKGLVHCHQEILSTCENMAGLPGTSGCDHFRAVEWQFVVTTARGSLGSVIQLQRLSQSRWP